jgi:hypothetical protein
LPRGSVERSCLTRHGRIGRLGDLLLALGAALERAVEALQGVVGVEVRLGLGRLRRGPRGPVLEPQGAPGRLPEQVVAAWRTMASVRAMARSVSALGGQWPRARASCGSRGRSGTWTAPSGSIWK